MPPDTRYNLVDSHGRKFTVVGDDALAAAASAPGGVRIESADEGTRRAAAAGELARHSGTLDQAIGYGERFLDSATAGLLPVARGLLGNEHDREGMSMRRKATDNALGTTIDVLGAVVPAVASLGTGTVGSLAAKTPMGALSRATGALGRTEAERLVKRQVAAGVAKEVAEKEVAAELAKRTLAAKARGLAIDTVRATTAAAVDGAVASGGMAAAEMGRGDKKATAQGILAAMWQGAKYGAPVGTVAHLGVAGAGATRRLIKGSSLVRKVAGGDAAAERTFAQLQAEMAQAVADSLSHSAAIRAAATRAIDKAAIDNPALAMAARQKIAEAQAAAKAAKATGAPRGVMTADKAALAERRAAAGVTDQVYDPATPVFDDVAPIDKAVGSPRAAAGGGAYRSDPVFKDMSGEYGRARVGGSTADKAERLTRGESMVADGAGFERRTIDLGNDPGYPLATEPLPAERPLPARREPGGSTMADDPLPPDLMPPTDGLVEARGDGLFGVRGQGGGIELPQDVVDGLAAPGTTPVAAKGSQPVDMLDDPAIHVPDAAGVTPLQRAIAEVSDDPRLKEAVRIIDDSHPIGAALTDAHRVKQLEAIDPQIAKGYRYATAGATPGMPIRERWKIRGKHIASDPKRVQRYPDRMLTLDELANGYIDDEGMFVKATPGRIKDALAISNPAERKAILDSISPDAVYIVMRGKQEVSFFRKPGAATDSLTEFGNEYTARRPGMVIHPEEWMAQQPWWPRKGGRIDASTLAAEPVRLPVAEVAKADERMTKGAARDARLKEPVPARVNPDTTSTRPFAAGENDALPVAGAGRPVEEVIYDPALDGPMLADPAVPSVAKGSQRSAAIEQPAPGALSARMEPAAIDDAFDNTDLSRAYDDAIEAKAEEFQVQPYQIEEMLSSHNSMQAMSDSQMLSVRAKQAGLDLPPEVLAAAEAVEMGMADQSRRSMAAIVNHAEDMPISAGVPEQIPVYPGDRGSMPGARLFDPPGGHPNPTISEHLDDLMAERDPMGTIRSAAPEGMMRNPQEYPRVGGYGRSGELAGKAARDSILDPSPSVMHGWMPPSGKLADAILDNIPPSKARSPFDLQYGPDPVPTAPRPEAVFDRRPTAKIDARRAKKDQALIDEARSAKGRGLADHPRPYGSPQTAEAWWRETGSTPETATMLDRENFAKWEKRQGAPAAKSGLLSTLANIGTGLEVAQAIGVHTPFDPDKIPLVGPLLGAYLKLRGGMMALKRFGILTPATGHALAVERSMTVRNGIARSVDGMLAGAGKTAKATGVVGPLVAWRLHDILSKPVIPGVVADAKRAKMTEEDALTDHANEVRAMATNLDAIAAAVRRGLPPGTDPDLVAATVEAAQRKVTYLAEHAPVEPPSQLFRVVKWVVSFGERVKYARRVRAANDPSTVWTDIANGTLTAEAIDAYKNVYPDQYEEMKAYLVAQQASLRAALGPEQIAQLSALFGTALRPGLEPENMQRMQEAGVTPPSQQTGGAPQGPAMGLPSPGGPTGLAAAAEPTAYRGPQ